MFVAGARRGRPMSASGPTCARTARVSPVRLSVTPLVAADGELIGFMGIAADLRAAGDPCRPA